MSEQVYLKQNVLAEPLYNQWYAWVGLIAPASAALYVVNSHLKIMRSFVSSPQVHISALKNPAMLGGPYINHSAGAVGEIQALLEKTAKEQAHMVKLAEEIKATNEVLENEANGYSMEALYAKVPEGLRGYVELVYDLNDHPSLRFIEGLLYKSRYYNEASQSLALSLIAGDERSFVFSTPRLEGTEQCHLKIPFADERLDELFQMKTVAQPYQEIKQRLAVSEEDAAAFSSLFTDRQPDPPDPPDPDAVRIRYFGHATVLIQAKGINILTDPVISYNHGNGIERYTFADLPGSIDYVVITHGHQDHCMLETLLPLRHKIKNLVVPKNNGGSLADPSMKLALRQIGFRNVIELEEMESIEFDGGSITGLPFLGEHADLNIRTKLAFLIKAAGNTIVCAADSNNIEPRMYEHIHEFTGDIDILFLGMECDGAPLSWIYGSLITKPIVRKLDQSRRLNGSDCERGLKIVEQLKPKQTYVYAMGQEPWMTFVTSIRYTSESRPIIESDKLVEACISRGIISERLYGKKEILLPLR